MNMWEGPRLSEVELERFWRELTDLGPRFPGTPAETSTLSYLRAQLEGLPLTIWGDDFNYLGWSLQELPRLRLLAPEQQELDCLAMIYCGATPPGGITGRVEYLGEHWIIGDYKWDKFAITRDGKTVGYISGRRDGRAIMQPLGEASRLVPHFSIGTADAQRLMDWCEAGIEVQVNGIIRCHLDPQARAQNLIATYVPPRGSSERIGICCHLDSMFVCPGANDNAGGMTATLALARYYAENGAPCTIDFIFFNGEEWDLAGSKAFVARHLTPERARTMKMLINLDGIADAIRELQLWVGPEGFEHDLKAAVDGFLMPNRISKLYRFPPPMGADHVPFYNLGVPVCMMTGYEMVKYHSPADVCHPEGVKGISYAAELTRHLVDHFAERKTRYETRQSTQPKAGWGAGKALGLQRGWS